MREASAKLAIRVAQLNEAQEISSLSARVYPPEDAYTASQILGQINNFPEGVFVAEYEGKIVGYCATSIIEEALALRQHTWDEITGGGFGSRHNPDGDVLYGIEVCVDPAYRRLRIGQRFYRARRELCRLMELKSIVFGGRMPGYQRRRKDYPVPADYLRAVQDMEIRDQVINFQFKQDFEALGVLEGYLPDDKQSGGHAVHMRWTNPLAETMSASRTTRPDRRLPGRVRVATVQF